jgi:hypothetical protein
MMYVQNQSQSEFLEFIPETRFGFGFERTS